MVDDRFYGWLTAHLTVESITTQIMKLAAKNKLPAIYPRWGSCKTFIVRSSPEDFDQWAFVIGAARPMATCLRKRRRCHWRRFS
jgi:hypothetical protein